MSDVSAPSGGGPAVERAEESARLPARFGPWAPPSRPAVVAAAGVVAILGVAYLAGPTLAQFVIGLILVLVLDPVVSWLSARGLNRGVAAILAILALGLAAVFFLTIVLQAILEQGPAFFDAVAGFLASLRDGIAASGLPAFIKDAMADIFGQLEQGASSVDLGAVLVAMAEGLFALLGPVVSVGLVLPFFMFYVLADLPRIARGVTRIVPAQWRDDVVHVAGIGVGSVATYIRAEAILMAWVGSLTFLGLLALGFVVDARIADFAIFLAVVAAISELVPTFGPYIALIPALVFAATIGPPALVAVLALYLVIMFVEGQVLVPRIEGGQFELHPALVIVLILGALAVIGPLGAVLAMPIAAAARDGFRYVFRRSAGLSPAAAAGRSPVERPAPAPTGGAA
jgi:predicted PurR-regulated permease PerM